MSRVRPCVAGAFFAGAAVVQLENITVSFAGQPILKDISWRVGDRDRVGLVGPNGSGKTTLLRLLMGDLVPERGEVLCTKGTTFGYLPQEQLTMAGRTLFEEVMTVFSRVTEIEDRLRDLEHRMADLPSEGPLHDETLAEYAKLQHEFDARDGFTVEARAATVLSGLGFSESDHGRKTEEFSGGWQMRIALARLLLEDPSVLLLDEPTNHLDLESMMWLEDYLKEYQGAVILVSHDRTFLDNVVTRISELSVEGLVDYSGNYAAFRELREKRRETLRATREQQERRIAHYQSFVARFKGNKAKTALVRSREKMIERVRSELVEVPTDGKSIRFEFPDPERGGSVTVSLKGVRQAYGDKVVFRSLDLDVARGDRVALVGANGAGKSTLLKIMGGIVPIDAGERRLGHNVTLQYFGQNPAKSLNGDNTVFEEVASVAPDEMRPRLRGLLGAFLFHGDDIQKKVRVLSGGEKSRVAIAKMLLRPANFLLLDEPTNHLDMASREVLEEALAGYAGTICLVSHDRSFMDAIANKVIEVDSGNLRLFHGSYSDYLWKKEREAVEAGGRSETAGRRRERPKSGGPKSKAQKRREAEERRRRSASKSRAREERRGILEEIASSERRLEELDIELVDPSVYTDGEKMRVLVNEQRALRARVDELYERWAELED
ncbi:MAG: ATP-binding cassette domain-containing protein [Candidatus Eisenbacteria bacterium]|nr:ATP-binding cassette domain-containing protein [Candidatus Eisenbacteria bacterium]